MLPAFVFLLFSTFRATVPSDVDTTVSPPEEWNLHVQATYVGQGHPGFQAKYSGFNSLNAQSEFKSSLTATIFAGASVWNGGEVYCNPELVGGEGFSRTTGIAGFPNGEIFRIGDPHPTVTIARLFLRQTFGLGAATENVSSDANQIASIRAVDRLVFTLGKFSVVDLFDDNMFSHDARTQFLDWALMDNGAWDYPADTRGYAWGITFEFYKRPWAVRMYAVMVPLEANGITMDSYISRAHGEALEVEYRYALFDQPGVSRVSGYVNNARMGTYRDALLSNPMNPDITLSRGYGAYKIGYCLDVEQNLQQSIGMFLRCGWNDGKTETWAFTEIDNTVSLGISMAGTLWSQPEESAGVAVVLNGLSPDHKAYLAAGGYGFIIGDGALSYGSEFITEGYFKQEIIKNITLSCHIQYVVNPAYNRDRGPVSIFSVRAHLEI
jgi:high affinity Mn2+ porin